MFSSSSSPPFGRRSASFLSLIPNTGDGSGIEAVADAAQRGDADRLAELGPQRGDLDVDGLGPGSG
jgi:hypothetical protein